MSKSEKFFNPSSLLRIARAVEWEPNLEYDAKGSSNQAAYMEAIAELYRKWLTDETFPEFVEVASAIGREDWMKAFQLTIENIPQKVAQFVGWWRGALEWRRGAARTRGLFGFPWGGPETVPVVTATMEDRIFLVVDQLVRSLREIVYEEETNG